MIIKPILGLTLGLLVTSSGLAQGEEPPITEHPFSNSEKAETAPALFGADAGVQADELESELVSINWIEEMGKGGITMIALALLSIVGLAITVERAIRMRQKHIAPLALIEKMDAMEGDVDSDRLKQICEAHPSTLARTLKFVYRHRDEPYEMVTTAASDMASREVRGQMGSIQLLGAVAGLAPLLGLLGTMIGMIESFKLVSIYGDDGGATILADSIAKALITTAAGLVIALPSLAAYHYFKHRLNSFTFSLEQGVESIVSLLYFHGISKPKQAEK